MATIEIRCPNCNKKAADTTKKSSQIITDCVRCAATFTYDNGNYTFKEPEDEARKRKFRRFNDKRRMAQASYQTRMNLRKK